jgi:hypothetical protein
MSGSFQTQPGDELGQGFACESRENTMKMKGREVRFRSQLLQRHCFIEMIFDVIENPVDAGDIFTALLALLKGIHRSVNTGYFQDSSDSHIFEILLKCRFK